MSGEEFTFLPIVSFYGIFTVLLERLLMNTSKRCLLLSRHCSDISADRDRENEQSTPEPSPDVRHEVPVRTLILQRRRNRWTRAKLPLICCKYHSSAILFNQ